MQLTMVCKMKKVRFSDWPCSVARTFDIFGDWWTPLIMREAFYGVRRFDEMQRRLGISRNMLADRLGRLVDNEILSKEPYQDRPIRHEYRLTDKGRALSGVVMAAIRWGDDWLAPDGKPGVLRDRRTGAEIRPVVVDEHTGEPIDIRNVTIEPGPGFPKEFRGEAAERWMPPPVDTE